MTVKLDLTQNARVVRSSLAKVVKSARKAWSPRSSFHMSLYCLLMTASELLLKRGAQETAHVPAPDWLAWTGIMTLSSGWVLAGIGVYIIGFFNWLLVLRWVPLNIAYPVTSVVYVLIALGAWLFLGEKVGALRWLGIGLINAGVILCAHPVVLPEKTR